MEYILETFESAVDSLLSAAPRNSSKGKEIKKWAKTNFNLDCRVSHITDPRAIGNRVSEQMRYNSPLVVFVCDNSVNIDTLKGYIDNNTYSNLSDVLIIGNVRPYDYIVLLHYKDNPFYEWIKTVKNIPIERKNIEGYIQSDESDTNVVVKEISGRMTDTSIFSKQQFLKQQPLQQIFYGAPGTGKSHEIKKLTEGKSVIRTTFHPDSDYSTFVGAYKPTMEDVDVKVVPVVVKSGISLEDSGTYKEKRIVYKFIKQAFLKAYLLAWKNYTDVKTVTSVIDSTSTGIDADDEREIISNAIRTDNPNLFNNGNPNEIPDNNQGNRGEDKTKLIAEPSCKPVFLIIEEINRGNCAQIFGDLFQLLDRGDNEFSEYPIEADTDLQQEIARAFKEDGDYKLTRDINVNGVVKDYISTRKGGTLSKDIQDGRILLLPPNLYIWATMNTSDQSLFPIDSAFKRRWEWKYIPIGYKNTNWIIEIGDGKEVKRYEWVEFQRNINEKIYEVDSSEDKKLGDYFVNADRTGGVISADTLLNKILFYLWNDVCKDDPDQIFRWIDEKKEEKSIKFSEFFEDDKEKKLQGFMAFHKVPEKGESSKAKDSEEIDETGETEREEGSIEEITE